MALKSTNFFFLIFVELHPFLLNLRIPITISKKVNTALIFFLLYSTFQAFFDICTYNHEHEQ
jgi:hypothetical protein